MNILVTGASGFIASHIVTTLIKAGHFVTCCVRNVQYAKNLFPEAKVMHCDFLNDTTTDHWLPRLDKIDIVINCVGILYHPNKKVIWTTHYDTPKALFDACLKTNVKKIIQFSALGVETSTVDYASSKKKIDDYLMTLPIKSIVLRPSLVYGKGSFGGTSLFRGLAGLPWIIPVPGKGQQTFQPIHLDDLSKSILYMISPSSHYHGVLCAVGPEKIVLKDILLKLRKWLGFPNAIVMFIPMAFIRIGSWLGNLMPDSSLNVTSYKMMQQNNITSDEETKKFHYQVGFIPRSFTRGVYTEPSSVQDHWHARLYLLKPALQLSLAFLWIFSAFTGALLYPKSSTYAMLSQMGLPEHWQPMIHYGTCVFDALLGLALLCHYQIKKACILQIIAILGYTAIITCTLPYLWLDPFGPITKNIPLLVATFILLALESDR